MNEVRIPQASMEMTEAEIETWLVADGDTVTEGQPIYELATDKVTMEVESPAGGTITLVGEVGHTYQVGDLIATIA